MLESIWWRAFGAEQLSALIERAVRDNLDVAQARERIVMARAARGGIEADRGLRVDGSAGYTRAGSGGSALAFNAPPPGLEVDLFAAGFTAG